MPGPEVHTYIDRLLFGKSYWKIHKAMDRPFRKFGRRHRMLFHDPLSAFDIASRLYPGDPKAIQAALYHIIIDDICSRDPEFRDYLEALVRLDRRKRRRKRK